MAKQELLTVIDRALAALKTARQALANETGSKDVTSKTGKPGTPRGSMSEEGRQRVAEAQRKRWAKQKRAAKKAARQVAK